MSAPLWTAAELAAATGGRAHGIWSVGGISIDSRTIAADDLFVALRGPHHDGHDFVADVLRQGAAALVDRLPTGVDAATARLVEVGDTMQALTALGRAARTRSRARIAAITGSAGKTGIKEALRLALAAQAPTHASAASHNNHWGVPLSLARAPRDSVYGIYELGMNAPGEIAALAALVRPQVAMITTIAPAHLGFFPSLAAIAEAKGEIFGGLEQGGTAIINLDAPHAARLVELARAAGAVRVLGFGEAPDAFARLCEVRPDAAGSDVVMTLDGAEIAYRVGAPGRHWVDNSLGVIACAAALGADPHRAAGALADFHALKGRGARHALRRAGGTVTLIDESYNANPASMRAALALLANAPGRKLAALGDMLELGEQAAALHAALAEPAVAAGADRVFTVGSAMRHLHERLPAGRRAAHADRAQDLLPLLEAELRAGDTLLIKGSLGIGMGWLVSALLAKPTAALA